MKPLKIILVALLTNACLVSAATVTITEDSLQPGKTYNWTANNTYLLKGFVFVKAGARLNIEAGTVIKGTEGTGSKASALTVCRDGRIYARGTVDKPIIFTCESDDVNDPSLVGYDPNVTKGMWGGVILCGRAPNSVNGQVMQAEGIPVDYGDLIKYGDSTNALNQKTGLPIDSAKRAKNIYDTTGVMQYVSIRHPGSELTPNKEINGLTFCSIGKGTVIDHIEIFNSGDDGFEWFGGTVDVKYLVSAFSDDDSYDYDQGYNGRAQFLFALQNSDENHGNRLGEFDSDDGLDIPSNMGALPYSKPVWYNCTFIGSGIMNGNTSGTGNDYALIYKENSGGTIVNSIIGNFSGVGVGIENKTGTEVDALGRLRAGDIKVYNNIFFNLGQKALTDSAYAIDSLKAWKNVIIDPKLNGICYTDSCKKLDPRLAGSSPAAVASNAAALPAGDNFFVKANYLGAFDTTNLWICGWTLLSKAGYTIPNCKPVAAKISFAVKNGMVFSAAPQANTLKLNISLKAESNVSVGLFSANGKLAANLYSGSLSAGNHVLTTDASKLARGVYLCRFVTPSNVMTQKVTLVQ